ncbi:LUC7 N terminus domain-containing protein [Actinidia rufa]|uniref:LUC7 N terminus domain-containing protein n=1 Tax=Actinidia rufa TaxID=165716 RepID=A0A7J0GWQ8_9ERIC|nr:LUC7 N terminus domain-containing protein [Actinidia rufa]
MALCEICGSFLIANDAAERTQSHVTGKQHIGYGMVRDFIAEHKAAKDKAHEEERLARERESEERRNQREKEYTSRGIGTDTGNEPVSEKVLARKLVEEAGMGEEDQIGSKTITGSGRDGGRDKHRDRSRSRSPVRHGHRRSSRSPGRPY